MYLLEENAFFPVTSNIDPPVQGIATWAKTLLVGSEEEQMVAGTSMLQKVTVSHYVAWKVYAWI